MSYHFVMLGVGVAAALYFYFVRHRPQEYSQRGSWNYNEKYHRNDEECPICYEVMKPGNYITLNSCKHVFHKVCFGNLIQQSAEAKCPLCRQPIS